jgi:predicted amidophosphoribosyltransferase
MKQILTTIFDLIFPRRDDDAAIADILPARFYEKIPRYVGMAYPDIYGIFHYKHPTAMAMIKELKSYHSERAAKIGAYALLNFLTDNEFNEVIIIPMPISEKRRRRRGYNQCEFLVDFLEQEIRRRRSDQTARPDDQHRSFKITIRTDILTRPVETKKLALENRATRIKSVSGIFAATCTLADINQRIIVIDDVVTTGSTMAEALQTLRKSGAKNVIGIGLAH